MSMFIERHLSVQQVAQRRNLSNDTIRRIFMSEPGVIVHASTKANTRIYRTLRIPESVEKRVFERLRNGRGSKVLSRL